MISAKSGRNCTFSQRKSKRTKDSTFLTHRSPFFLNLQRIVRVLRKRTGATGERNKCERFLDFVFLPEFRKTNKQTQMQNFFLEFWKKESKRPPSGPYTRFDLQTTAVCETHELHRWSVRG